MPPKLLVFDFDGLVVDSETASNLVLAEAITALGRPTSVEESLARYMGRRWADCAALIEDELGRALPEGFVEACQAKTRAHHETELEAVPGVAAFIAAHAHIPRCVASSSRREWLEWALARVGLAEAFGDRLFSATQVAHGKPAPDLFLLAAREMGVAPAEALVIEDSVPGVQAGVAAGMTVIGLTAGSHTRPGHAEQLAAAGAHHVAASYADLSDLLASA